MVFMLIIARFDPVVCQPAVSSHLLSHPWSAQWITHPTASGTEYGVFHFRKTFDLESVSEHFIINITAVPRYQLYVNGHYVNEGPSKGDLDHWKFETIDIASYLVTGKNVIAALLINFAELAPESVTGSYSQFLIQGNSSQEDIVNSDTYLEGKNQPGLSWTGRFEMGHSWFLRGRTWR